MRFIQEAAEESVREMLCALATKNNMKEIDSVFQTDWMDNGSPIAMRLEINKKTRSAIFDFNGSGIEVCGNFNTPIAVVRSAIIYCLRCLINIDIPLNSGCLRPIEIIIPENSILNPSDDAAIVGGNVTTSQRITDVVLKAFGAVSDSQGCMNNFTFGSKNYGYYETIAGGAGAGPGWNGCSGVHSHMTNTRITDAEVLETRYPVLLNRFALRYGSGGDGAFKGGDGVIREFTFLDESLISLVTERRVFQPKGINGGGNAMKGENLMVTPDEDGKKGKTVNLGGKQSLNVPKGTRIIIMTPGGGGYGEKGKYTEEELVQKNVPCEGFGSYNREMKMQEQG